MDLGDIIARATDAVRPAAIAKNISLTLEDLSNCLVHGDPERLQQVFWNLLSNAVKFTPSGGFVRVDVARNDHTLAVTVADSGVGILQAVHPVTCSTGFVRAIKRPPGRYGGLGLGLSIVKHLTELHGGTGTVSQRRSRSGLPIRGAAAGACTRRPITGSDRRISSLAGVAPDGTVHL